MLRSLALLAVLCVASAATVDQRTSRYHAEERDSSSHQSHHGSSGGEERDSSSHHGSSLGSSSYSAPSHSAPSHAPAAASPAASYGGGNEQGNLYYYYYPVDDYGSTEAADAGFDIFTAIILPLLILGGLLLALSSLTFTFTGRAMRGEDAEPGIADQLQTEVERIFYIYLNAFESEACIQRAVCQTGVYAKNFKNKEFYMSMVEPLIPETMRGNMAIFKMAAKDGFDTGKCKKYHCTAPKIFQ